MSSATNYRYQKVNKPAPSHFKLFDGTISKSYMDACTWKGCEGQQIVAVIAYDYITGKKGRWSYAEKFVCQKHLDQWLKKHPEAQEIK